MRLILVLHNIRSTYNVGAILRTAEGFGVERVILSGLTPTTKWTEGVTVLPHILEKTTRQIAKTALGAEKMVFTVHSENIMASIRSLSDDGWLIAGLENNITDGRLHSLGEKDLRLGGKVVLILGEEVNGIPDRLYHAVNIFLEIPMRGRKESFNVSVAAGIALWELLGKSDFPPNQGVVC